MTGIDLLVGTFLSICLSRPPERVAHDGQTYTVQVYECPLAVPEAPLLIWRHYCSDQEQPAIAFYNLKTHTGWVLNRFLDVSPGFVRVEELPVYAPLCMTEELAP